MILQEYRDALNDAVGQNLSDVVDSAVAARLAIDYRVLLKKYMNNVAHEEGSYAIPDQNDRAFTAEEIFALGQIHDELNPS